MDWIDSLFDAATGKSLILVGLALLVVSSLRKIGDWVELNHKGQRIIAGILGGTLLVVGIALERNPIADEKTSQSESSVEIASPQLKEEPLNQTSSSQILMLVEDTWRQINPNLFIGYQEEEHNVTERKRDAFLTTETKLNSIDISTDQINTTVEQLGGEWMNTAPGTWNDTVVSCFIKIQRQNGGIDYIPCQISGSSGSCNFSWQLDASGRRCGGRAASERSGG